MRNRVCSCLAPKLRDDFDISYNVVVQCFQISPRYPVFSMLRAADDVNLVPLQEVASYHEAQHVTNETRAFVLCIPVAGNRGCVRFSEYRIEKRLWRQSRREPAKSGRTNQVEFTLSNRTVKRRNFFWHRLQNSALNEKNYALQALIMTSAGAILCACAISRNGSVRANAFSRTATAAAKVHTRRALDSLDFARLFASSGGRRQAYPPQSLSALQYPHSLIRLQP